MPTPTDDHRSKGPDAGSQPDAASAPAAGRLRFAVVGAAVAIGLIVGVVLATTGGGEPGSGPVITGRETKDGTAASDEKPDSGTNAGSSAVAGTAPAMTVTAVPLDGSGALEVTVEDLAAPTSPVAPTRLCALVTYSAPQQPAAQQSAQPGTGPPIVEAYGCADPGGAADLSLDPGVATVGCAAVADRNPPAAEGVVEAAATLTVTPVAPMQAGSYQVTVEAISGFGDGCPPPEDGIENAASTSLTVEVG